MAGYSATPLWKKLGLKPGMNARVIGAPEGYHTRLLAGAPEVRWGETGGAPDFVHLFATRRAEVEATLAGLRHAMRTGAMVWVSWPKQASGITSEINENLLRQIALPMGWVDIKVCAVDEVWSGLKFVIRKSMRCV